MKSIDMTIDYSKIDKQLPLKICLQWTFYSMTLKKYKLLSISEKNQAAESDGICNQTRNNKLKFSFFVQNPALKFARSLQFSNKQYDTFKKCSIKRCTYVI